MKSDESNKMFSFGFDGVGGFNTDFNPDFKFTPSISMGPIEVKGIFKMDEYVIALMSGCSNEEIKDLAVKNIKRDEGDISDLLKQIDEIKDKIKEKRKDIRTSKRRYKNITGVKYE